MTLRLNVGAGRFPLPGWTNLDADPAAPVEVHAAVPPLPYPDESAEEIAAIHFLEHLPKPMADEFLAECFRVLQPGGRLGLVVPDTRAIMRLWLDGDPVVCEMPPGRFWKVADLDDVCAIFLFSTYQDSPHVWAWDFGTLRRAMERAGFVVTGEIDRFRDPRLGNGAWYQVGVDAVKP